MAVPALETLVPASRRGQKLQANGERVHSQRLAIGYARTGAKVSLSSMQVEPLVSPPRFGGNDARAMPADVFCNAFLGTLVDIQTPKIHSYCNGHAIFQTPSQSLHEDTLVLAGQGGKLNIGMGTTGPSYSRTTRWCQEISNKFFRPRRFLRNSRIS